MRPRARWAVALGLLSSGLGACSLLVGDGSFAVGHADGGGKDAGGGTDGAGADRVSPDGGSPDGTSTDGAGPEGATAMDACGVPDSGTCSGDACAPTPLFQSTTASYQALASDGTDLYAAAPYKIWKCGVTGAGNCGGNPSPFFTGGVDIAGVAVDGSNVYWTDSALGSVTKCPKTSTSCDGYGSVILSSTEASPTALAVDATDVYWLATNQIRRCAVGGCMKPSVFFAEPGDPPLAGQLALDATHVYWVTASGNLKACPKSGCTTPTSVAGGVSPPFGFIVGSPKQGAFDSIAATRSELYWLVASADPHSRSVFVAGCPTGDLDSGACFLGSDDAGSGLGWNPIAAAADDASVYLTLQLLSPCNPKGSAVVKRAGDGTWSTLYVEPFGAPTAIAVDDTSVYWVDQVGGSNKVLKTPK